MGEFSGFALVPEQGAIPQKGQLDPDMQRRIEAMAARIRYEVVVLPFVPVTAIVVTRVAGEE